MKIFLDMDGVLADFVKGACVAHLRDCYDKPEHLGIFDMEKLWGISVAEFYAPLKGFEFWASLDKTPEADAIVEAALKNVGPTQVAILTSPVNDPECVPAKRYWIEKHYPILTKNMIFAYKKGFIAGPEKVLVDDKDRNISEFVAGGGHGILVPRLWNGMYLSAHNTRQIVLEALENV